MATGEPRSVPMGVFRLLAFGVGLVFAIVEMVAVGLAASALGHPRLLDRIPGLGGAFALPNIALGAVVVDRALKRFAWSRRGRT